MTELRTMDDVFRALQSSGMPGELTLAQETIRVTLGEFQVVGYDLSKECVQLNRSGKGRRWVPVTHCHPESYADIHDSICYYLEHREEIADAEAVAQARYRRKILWISFTVFVAVLFFECLKGRL
jgi:hypothetical protein